MSQELDSESDSYRSSQDSDYIPGIRETREFSRADLFLDGAAKSVYAVKSDILRNIEVFENTAQAKDNSLYAKQIEKAQLPCDKCKTVLFSILDQFQSIKHDAKTLVNRKASHPKPTKGGQCRNITDENRWLREHVFDAVGNYIYCQECIIEVFRISKGRLARQRDIKRMEAFFSVTEMTKRDVEAQNLTNSIIIPEDFSSFDDYLGNLEADDCVEIRQEVRTHGLAGKRSNNKKEETMHDFLDFVDLNSQHNGRSANTAGPHYYFFPIYTRIQMPSITDKNYGQKLPFSVVGVFNQRQEDAGNGKCSNGSAVNWLQEHRPKHAITPHQKDYCDTCKEYETQIRSIQTDINRKRQNGNNGNDVTNLEALRRGYAGAYSAHKNECCGGV